ncbi:hypothetical protein UPYG_G00304840 [Umbra pygmaea]|uniref:Uncharacterized protein n=1 Tax=Umbra pygmaea TaxID=75934 RepID=A0ABD0VYP4_UMBPY
MQTYILTWTSDTRYHYSQNRTGEECERAAFRNLFMWYCLGQSKRRLEKENMAQSKNSSEEKPPPYFSDSSNPDGHSPGHLSTGRVNVAVVCHVGQYNIGQAGIVEHSPQPPAYNCFDDKAIERGFIKKVYLTLTLQHLVTVGIIGAFLYWKALRRWLWYNYWFTFMMLGILCAVTIVFACCRDQRRKVPLNFLALALCTLVNGTLLGSCAANYNAEPVMWFVGALLLVSWALTVFPFQAKWDFTLTSASLYVFMWTLLSFAVLSAIIRSQYLYIMLACMGSLVISFFQVLRMHRTLRGKNKYTTSPEEYIFAALNTYL